MTKELKKETYDTQEAMLGQYALCEKNNYPHFASSICFACKKDIYQPIEHVRKAVPSMGIKEQKYTNIL